MKNQKGQATVEFAFVAPIFFAMCLGMIYGGMLFMDYLQFNNAARAFAREISLVTVETDREKLIDDFKNNNSEYIRQITKLYTATSNVHLDEDGDSVVVEIDLTLNEEDLPGILSWINFPPKKLKAVEVVMPVEKIQSSGE